MPARVVSINPIIILDIMAHLGRLIKREAGRHAIVSTIDFFTIDSLRSIFYDRFSAIHFLRSILCDPFSTIDSLRSMKRFPPSRWYPLPLFTPAPALSPQSSPPHVPDPPRPAASSAAP